MSERDTKTRRGGRSSQPFIGRDAELDVIDRAVAAAAGGTPTLVFVSGEAGIGKSALVHEAAFRAAGQGVRVAWGRCTDSEGAPAYWPWSQILRTCADLLAGPIVGVPARGVELIGRIAPEVTGGEVFELDDDADERSRFELSQAVTWLMGQIAAETSLLLVIEDIHLADPGSLQLVSHVINHLGPAKLAVVATLRPDELTPAASELTAGTASIAETVHLEGLGRSETAALVTELAGSEVHPSVVGSLADFTAGNPLFVRELVHMLAAEHRLAVAVDADARLTVPPSVRDVIRQRTAPLPEAVAEVVATAAVIGREFEFALLQAVTGFPAPDLLDRLGEAAAGGLLDEVAGPPTRYRFHHALLRTVVYDELQKPARAELHRRVADALEAVHEADPDPHRSQLAHHLYEAASLVEPRRVADAAVAAGDRAVHLLAFAEAEHHFQTAHDVLTAAGLAHDEQQAELLLSLGNAQRRAGSRATRATLRQAFAVARRSGDAPRMARAALAMQVGVATIGTESTVDGELAAHLEEALAALGTAHADLRARILGVLAETYYWDGPVERARALGEEAVVLAEEVGDDAALARALVAHHYASWAPDNADERLGIADRILDLATRARSPEITFMAHSARITVMFEVGDMTAVDRELSEVERVAASLGQPIVTWALERWHATRALVDGRLDDARRHMNAAAALADATQYPDPILEYWAIQVYALHLTRGTLDQIADTMRANVRSRSAPGYRSALAALEAEVGNTAAARVEVGRFVSDGLAALRRDLTWMHTVAALCVATAATADAAWCDELYELAAPLGHRCVVVGDGTHWNGPLAQWLAPVAHAAGRVDEAEQLFERALTINRRAGALPHLVMTVRRYADFLDERDREGDRARREQLVEEALEICDRCDLPGHRQALLDRDPGGDAVRPGAAGSDATVVAEMRPSGDHWDVAFGRDRAFLRDLRGLHYLSTLIESPGREFHVLDLAGARAPESTPRAHGEAEPSDAGLGPTLDGTAKRAYRRRLDDLRADLDEAEHHGDGERAARAREEIDAIGRELAAAMGLGGRDRAAGEDAERARVAVTKAIRTAIARIGEHVPGLATHLDVSVRTGTFCAYAPDPAARVDWSG